MAQKPEDEVGKAAGKVLLTKSRSSSPSLGDLFSSPRSLLLAAGTVVATAAVYEWYTHSTASTHIDARSSKSAFSQQSPARGASELTGSSPPLTPALDAISQSQTDELQLVLDALEYAQTRDLDLSLRRNEPALIDFRDKVYSEAKAAGVTCDSSAEQRLEVVERVVEFLFHNVKPPDAYTKNTDIGHFREVAALATQSAKKKGMTDTPPTLVLCCWLHDVERFIPSTKCKYLPEKVDKYRKQVIHPLTSARVAMCLFEGSPLTESEKQRVFDIIIQHDKPTDQSIVVLGRTILDVPSADILEELELLMDADSLAFFRHTVGYFVETKAKKHSSEWLWTRIVTNVKRLRSPLRFQAVEYMDALSDDIKRKMGWKREQLTALCAVDSGTIAPK